MRLVEQKPCKYCGLFWAESEMTAPYCALPKDMKCQAIMKTYQVCGLGIDKATEE
jgi:hypothetical protein